MDKLHIGLINDSFPPAIDGVANAVTNYATVITQQGGSAFVTTPYYPNADDSVFPFPVIRYPSIDTTKLLGYRAGLPFSAETLRQVAERKPDLLHSHCPITSTMLARTLRERIDVPIVFTYHTKFDVDIANSIRGELLREEAIRLIVDNISACDEVWTVSYGAGENLRSLGYAGEYRVMPNGVDFPAGRVSDEAVKRETARCDLPADVPLYLFVGRMMWYKGIRITLDALKHRMEAGADFRMVFIGAGGDYDEIMEYAASLGLAERVFFLGAIHERERIRAWYCRADLFLFPSTFDTNGLVVREAAACALPSVLIRGSCAAEDITDGQNGFLIEENAESMADILERLTAETMKQTGEHAQREIYLSWEDAVKNAYDRYGAVIEKYRSGTTALREKPSDEFYEKMAELMEWQESNRQRQRALQESFRNRLGELRTELQLGGREAGRERLRSRDDLKSEILRNRGMIRSEVQRNWDEIVADIRLNRALFHAELEENRERLEDFLDDIMDWLDDII